MSCMKIPYQKAKPKMIDSDYIYHKNERGKPPKKDLPLLKKRYHNNFEVSKTCHI